MLLLLIFFVYSKGTIHFTLALVAGVLEVLDEGQTQRVNEGTERRHGEVQEVTDDEDDDEGNPLPGSTVSPRLLNAPPSIPPAKPRA